MKLTALGVWTHSYAGPTTSFYAEFDNARILIDTGTDPINRMRQLGISPTECSHLYLSHMHSDHSSGFSNFVFTRELLGRPAKDRLTPLKVLGSPPVIEGCQTLLKLQYPDRSFNILWVPLLAGKPTTISDGVVIETVSTIHPVDCHGCRISSRGVDLGFTADTAPMKEHADFFLDCAVLLGEAFGLEARVGMEVNKRGHSTAEDLGRLVVSCKARYVIPFHFGPECADATERAMLLDASRGGIAKIIDPVSSPHSHFD
jgi:ribonuclease BN (tRNA processing enzyme)